MAEAGQYIVDELPRTTWP